MSDEAGLQARLDAKLAESSAARPAAVNETLAATARWLRESGAVDRALGVGDHAPDFELPNALGRQTRLGGLLDAGPVVLTFYRGGW